jgi:predicted transcriptional regulator
LINNAQETADPKIDSTQEKQDKETEVLELVRAHWKEHGDVIFAEEIQRQLKLSSGTRQRILDKLVKECLIEKVSVNIGQGRPKIGIKPLV